MRGQRRVASKKKNVIFLSKKSFIYEKLKEDFRFLSTSSFGPMKLSSKQKGEGDNVWGIFNEEFWEKLSKMFFVSSSCSRQIFHIIHKFTSIQNLLWLTKYWLTSTNSLFSQIFQKYRNLMANRKYDETWSDRTTENFRDTSHEGVIN